MFSITTGTRVRMVCRLREKTSVLDYSSQAHLISAHPGGLGFNLRWRCGRT